MIQSYLNSAEKQRSVQLQPREPQEESGKAEREKKNDSLLPVKLRLKIAYQQAVQNYNLHFLAIDHRQIYIGMCFLWNLKYFTVFLKNGIFFQKLWSLQPPTKWGLDTNVREGLQVLSKVHPVHLSTELVRPFG